MLLFFFFNDTATTEIYTLSLHDALPICRPSSWSYLTSTTSSGRSGTQERSLPAFQRLCAPGIRCSSPLAPFTTSAFRSEEHTSELQSRQYLVCRLLLEKKNKNDDKIVDI